MIGDPDAVKEAGGQREGEESLELFGIISKPKVFRSSLNVSSP
jgi:hypothetical protein